MYSQPANVNHRDVMCQNCGIMNRIPEHHPGVQYVCFRCGYSLEGQSVAQSSSSTAVGLIGGAALGAAVGGPAGAVIGGVVGYVIASGSTGDR